MRPTPLYRAYAALSAVALPFLARARVKRLRKAGVSAMRAHEVLGNASATRPGGSVIWVHAASVGESLSVLPLMSAMQALRADLSFVITTATPTAATLIEARKPPRTTHQFAPLDGRGPLKRFLATWRPDAVLLVESELWPNMLAALHDRGLPTALVNARLSEKSLRGWAKRPDTARFLLAPLALVLTQTEALRAQMVGLGTDSRVTHVGHDLKALTPPQSVNAETLAPLQQALQGHLVWAACSTHRGEEDAVLAAHKALLRRFPDLRLILAPRHPERAPEVAASIRAHELEHTTRSAGDAPTKSVYLADTLGELELWYTLAPFAFLGGSLTGQGGHNPFEPAHLGTPVISGPHVQNFQDAFDRLCAMQACFMVSEAEELSATVAALLETPARLKEARAALADFTTQRADVLDRTAKQVLGALLPPATDDAIADFNGQDTP